MDAIRGCYVRGTAVVDRAASGPKQCKGGQARISSFRFVRMQLPDVVTSTYATITAVSGTSMRLCFSSSDYWCRSMPPFRVKGVSVYLVAVDSA